MLRYNSAKKTWSCSNISPHLPSLGQYSATMVSSVAFCHVEAKVLSVASDKDQFSLSPSADCTRMMIGRANFSSNSMISLHSCLLVKRKCGNNSRSAILLNFFCLLGNILQSSATYLYMIILNSGGRRPRVPSGDVGAVAEGSPSSRLDTILRLVDSLSRS